MSATDHDLWLTIAAELKLDAEDSTLEAKFYRMLKHVSDNVEMLDEHKPKRASKKHVLYPVEQVEKTAAKLRMQLHALPQELFDPPDDQQFMTRLSDRLIDLEWLFDELQTIDVLAKDARQILKMRKPPDPRTLRHDVIGSSVAYAYRELTGEWPTVYTDQAAGKPGGTFGKFLRLIAEWVGIPEEETSSLVENRRTRFRSPYASTRADAAREKAEKSG